MENKTSTPGSGIIAMIPTVEDYDKMIQELLHKARITYNVEKQCYVRLESAIKLIERCKRSTLKFDFAAEETIKTYIFSTRDWLATKDVKRFDIISTLYKWKIEKFQHRAWDVAMTADGCEGILFRLMERVPGDSQNVAVTQVFLSIQELESCDDSSIRIETRLKDALEKLKTMVAENVPLVGISKQ